MLQKVSTGVGFCGRRVGGLDHARVSGNLSVATAPEYILIAGHGRSGTNWLLELLDQSPRTHGRNEPDELLGSPFESLPSPWAMGEVPEDFALRWARAVRWAARRIGERDQRPVVDKLHFHRFSRRLGLVRINDSPRARRWLRLAWQALNSPEWLLPIWLGSRERLAQALPVLKCTQIPAWARWVVENDPTAMVLHIVRHPGGFLNSWRNRYVSAHEQAEVLAANKRRLHLVADVDPPWGERFGDVDAMGLDESELWFWRYAAETTHAAGVGRERYRLILFERLARQAPPIAEAVYRESGLTWSDELARRVASRAADSVNISHQWQKKLNEEQVALIHRVLEGSLMNAWWDAQAEATPQAPDLNPAGDAAGRSETGSSARSASQDGMRPDA